MTSCEWTTSATVSDDVFFPEKLYVVPAHNCAMAESDKIRLWGVRRKDIVCSCCWVGCALYALRRAQSDVFKERVPVVMWSSRTIIPAMEGSELLRDVDEIIFLEDEKKKARRSK